MSLMNNLFIFFRAKLLIITDKLYLLSSSSDKQEQQSMYMYYTAAKCTRCSYRTAAVLHCVSNRSLANGPQ